MDLALKQEWIEKVKITQRNELWSQRGGRYSVNTELHLVPEELQQDRDIVLAALLDGKEFMWNIPQQFKADRNFIIDLLDNNYPHDVYQHCSALSEDQEIFERCMLRKEQLGWKKLPESILTNRELIWKTFQQNNFYEQVKEHYKYDAEIIRFHLTHYDAYEYKNITKRTLNKFKKDKDFYKGLITQSKSSYDRSIYSNIYLNFPEEMKTDLTIIEHLIKEHPYSIHLIPHEIKNDKGFILYMLSKYDISIDSCNDEIKNDPNVIHAVIERNGQKLSYFKNITDINLAQLALKTCSDIRILNKTFLNSKELVTDFLNANPLNCDILLELAPHYQNDYDIAKILVAYNGDLLKKTNLQDNEQLKDLALKTVNSLTLLTEKSIYNKSLVIKLLQEQVKSNSHEIRNFLEKRPPYQNDKDVAFISIQRSPDYFKFFPQLQQDKQFILSCLDKKMIHACHIDPSLLMNKELMLSFVQKNSKNYDFLPLSLRDDLDIVVVFLSFNKPSSLSTDRFLFDRAYDTFLTYSSKGKDIDFHTQLIAQVPEVYESQYITSELKNDPSIVRAYLNNTTNLNPSRSSVMMEKYNTSNYEVIRTELNREFLEKELGKREFVYKPKI